ncbi:MAG TPA: 3-isopropylmalate dehydratase small subunit [Vicinamibacterales bacterium]|nr:3-isopropylmalate dehydratase small subunit [Vicinamibacterales bacterium]
MQPLRVHRGRALPLLRRDIDTDQIIPKQFLKSVERSGFGRYLFFDWRCRADGSPDPDFVLNDARYEGASVLVAGANFGCGSSREHAAWALHDFGIRVIIAPSFADIFRDNAVTNGVLPVVLAEPTVALLAANAAAGAGYTLEIDLEASQVRDAAGWHAPFAIDDATRYRLLNGLDDITLVLQHEDEIRRFESTRRPPWSTAAAGRSLSR